MFQKPLGSQCRPTELMRFKLMAGGQGQAVGVLRAINPYFVHNGS